MTSHEENEMENYTGDQLTSLIESIKTEMAENTNVRRSLRERPKAEKTHVIDVGAWRRQLVALEAKGITGLNIGYWRISTVLQEEGLGPDLQQKAVISWAVTNTARNGIDLWVWDIDSGKEESREGFEFIREAVAGGNVRNVCAYRYDRLARNQYYSELIQREFKVQGTHLISATESMPDGFLGDFMRQILQAFAQYEAAVIVERMSRGKMESVRSKGVYGGGEVPYAYLAKGTRGDSGKGVLKVCESEAKVVRLVFELYERGYSQTAIATYLNHMGVPTRFQRRTGWRQGQVRRILIAEPAYRAEGLFSRVKDFEKVAHDAVLPHRANPEDRTYLFGNVPMLPYGTQVPDNLVGAPIKVVPRANTINSLTCQQASVVLLLFRLRDKGYTQKAIANKLNAMEVHTLEGRQWSQSTVQFYLMRRERFETALRAIGAESILILHNPPMANRNVEELEAVAQIRLLRSEGLSIKRITDKVNEQGYRTRMGNPWYQSTVERVLKGYVRDTERPPSHPRNTKLVPTVES